MKRHIFILLCIVLTAAGCNEMIDTDDLQDYRVRISALVDQAHGTRAPYVPATDEDSEPDSPTDENPLDVSIWASTDPRIFPDEGITGENIDPYKVAYHTGAYFTNGNGQLLEGIIYSKDKTWIYFIGLHPKETWTVMEGGKSASYIFDGKSDVMYSGKEHGYYSADGSVNPTLQFHHLLTWLRFELKAESEEVAATWGKVKEVRIHSRDKVTIDLSKTYEEDWKTCVDFDGATTFPLYHKESDDIFPGTGTPYTIPYKASEVTDAAYVLCAPVNASDQKDDYILDIVTDHRTASVPVNLKSGKDTDFSGSTMGKQFTLSLTFRPGNNISVAALVNDWQTGGVSSGTIN